MTDERLIAASDVNYYKGWQMFAGASGVAHEENGVLIAAPAIEPLWLNIVFVTRPLARAKEQLEQAFALLDERSIRFLVRIREGLDEAAERTLEQLGLRYTDTIPGMAMTPIPATGGRSVPLEIRQVEDDAAFAHFVAVTAESFEIAPDVLRRVMPPALRSTIGSYWYVGYLEGEPVAASALNVFGDTAGVNFVGTLDGYRGRGFGEAMTWRVSRKAAELGHDLVVLQASEMGYPIYERMGYRRVTGYKTFVRPEWIG